MVSWSASVEVLLGGSCINLYGRLWVSNCWVAVFRVSMMSSAGFPSSMSFVPTIMYTGQVFLTFCVVDYVLHPVGGYMFH